MGHGCGYQEGYLVSDCVMEDSGKAPEDKDVSKMNSQYQMFVDDVGSK